MEELKINGMKQEFIPYKKWLHQHDEDIKKQFPDRPTEKMAQEMGLNYYTISRRATRLGIGKSSAYMHTSWKKGADQIHNIKREDRKNIARYMKSHFANTRNEDIAKHFGVDVKTVRRWARRLNLVKSEDFMRKVRGSGKSNHPFYTPEQKAWRNQRITEVFPEGDDEALQQLSEELGISVMYIHDLAHRLGLRRQHFPSQLITELAEYFPTHTDKECAEHFCININSVRHIARKNGWKKSEEHTRKMYLQNATAAQDSNRRRSAD